jgi:sec-independent protein translocase protein TatB
MGSIPVTLAFFGFDSVGFAELLVIGAVVLIVVGPHRLPGALRKMGEMMSHLKRAANEFKQELMTMDEPSPHSTDNDVIDVESSESSDSSSDDSESGVGLDDEPGSSYSYDDSDPQMPDDMDSVYPGQSPYEDEDSDDSDSGGDDSASAEDAADTSEEDDSSKKGSVST